MRNLSSSRRRQDQGPITPREQRVQRGPRPGDCSRQATGNRIDRGERRRACPSHNGNQHATNQHPASDQDDFGRFLRPLSSMRRVPIPRIHHVDRAVLWCYCGTTVRGALSHVNTLHELFIPLDVYHSILRPWKSPFRMFPLS